MSKNDIRQFRLSTGEQIICEVLEWDDEETSSVLARGILKIIETDDWKAGIRLIAFRPFMSFNEDPDIIQMAMNPEVTVRFRGVMEKCTYCAQRVNRAKINTKINTGSVKPADGAVITACQQACPADAIYFGDLTDEQATVTQMKRNERNYLMLEELNVRPRTSYIAKLTNPNPALVDKTMPEKAY